MVKLLPVKTNLSFLDGLRGLAALYVATGHARWLLWEGGERFKQSHSYSRIGKAFALGMSMFKFGHEMVLFFFVLSGFVIHQKYSLKLAKGQDTHFTFWPYFMKRLKRIMPPYLFALLLTMICDSIVAHYQFSIYTHSTPMPVINENITFFHSWTTLIGNIFFLQDVYVPIFGSNGSIWSLKYEWYFYMVYPVLLFTNKRFPKLTTGVVAGIFLLYVAGLKTGFILLDQVMAALFSWWAGAIIADIYTGHVKVNRLLVYPFMIIVPLIPFIYGSGLPTLIKDQVIALGFSGLLLLLLDYRNKEAIKHFASLKWLGDCSYTLYLIHIPILVLANGILLRINNNHLPQTFLFVFLAVIFVTALAYALHYILEKPFTSTSKCVLINRPEIMSAMVK